ncbi:magnesium transporter [Oculatella sp. LEGE 06141]|uniref:magnesium transporter n=1 Tax=Oculatella sp. LEGE 06141 TaxID=1828648 RepID=UPI00187EFDA3|nr:magnesium transporter [Oculatella sp. LEGE 06141]MBE9180292.1 magnesium transporter [Oculatella sp. LEGE 06141]
MDSNPSTTVATDDSFTVDHGTVDHGDAFAEKADDSNQLRVSGEPVPLQVDREPQTDDSSSVAISIQALSVAEQRVALQNLPAAIAVEAFNSLAPEQQQTLLNDFKQQPVVAILAQRPLDERLALFELDAAAKGGESETDNYFETGLLVRVGRRIVWLIVLLLANTGTTAAIRLQEDVLQQAVVLAAFIPLLIGSAGNVSTQSATVMIRELSRNDGNHRQFWQRLGEQAIAGAIIGLVLGAVIAGIALVMKGNLDVALVVGFSLFATATLATLSGSLLPWMFKLLGFDPALMSAPLSSVVVDVIGILIYLYVARLVLVS